MFSYHYLIETFKTIIICSTFFMMFLFVFIRIILFLFLEKASRPNISDWPYSTFFDRFLPILFLVTPFLLIIIFKPFDSWFPRLLLLISIHIFILIPLLHYWSHLRSWSTFDNNPLNDSWYNPHVFKHLSIALIYPLLWGIFFSFSRYLRLGSSFSLLSIKEYVYNLSGDLIVIIFLLPYITLWLILFIHYMLYIRKALWNNFAALIYSSHIYLLQYYLYFKIMELLYKMTFLLECLLTINIKKDITLLDKVINHIYYNPKWFTLFMLFSIFVEILFTYKIYISIYILFYYPLIYGICSCLMAFKDTNFVYDCCLSDYCSQRDLFKTPRYPFNFWNYFRDAEYYFGHEYCFTDEQKEALNKEMNKKTSQWSLRKNTSYSIHKDLLNIRVLKQQSSSFGLRVAASYLRFNGVRWTHTQISLIPRIAVQTIIPNTWHTCTAYFAQDLPEKIALINNSWNHFKNLESLHAKKSFLETTQHIYKPFNITFEYKRTDLIGQHEENIPSSFVPLINKGVIIEPYNNKIHDQYLTYKPQSCPDVIFNFRDSIFSEKRILALDQKTTNNPGIGNNKLLSQISEQRYFTTLDYLANELRRKGLITATISEALLKLKQTCNDITQHQISWAEYIHCFPENYIPPLKLTRNFSYDQLTQDFLRKVSFAEIRLKRISDLLFAKKIPQVNHGIFPKEALEILKDSSQLFD